MSRHIVITVLKKIAASGHTLLFGTSRWTYERELETYKRIEGITDIDIFGPRKK